MESNIKSSFIPGDTVQSSSELKTRYAGTSSDIFVLISVVMFVASIALGIAVFLYLQFVESSVANKREQIVRAQAAFEPALIADMTRLDNRMHAAEDILYKHIAPSEFFRIMEEITLENISFSDLDFQSSENGTITITMNGVARSVNSIALQSKLFGDHSAIVSPIFSNITRKEDGVHFVMSAEINISAIRFVSNSASASQAVPSAPAEETIPFFGPQATPQDVNGTQLPQQNGTNNPTQSE